ncbi:hypothetical protein OVA14_01930 [Agrococcus sp. SL85]|uniref:hypothetical protein n=1 Tax=Agrococcus sp. SL85 TaxID=2995141 RepID=UPI00226CFBB7|nr:hypothetical protein [Agrococcus sp. SL85]WAC66568.1 hypothetical protein OVA14_01930 [Agrococcus sp. SL85]
MTHRTPPRRLLAAALVLGGASLALTGCIPMPPAVPTAAPTMPAPEDPTTSTEAADPTEEPTTPPSAGEYAYTVDDGLGDIWSFSVTSIDDNPPMESGEPADGTYFTAVRIDGNHDEGTTSFMGCFDVFVVGSDGQTYDWADTVAVTAEDDIYYVEDTFEGARAVVQLPEGVAPTQVILRSTYGHPDVPDTVLDVEG